MLPRCYLLARHVCQKVAIPSCEKNCPITITVRQLYLLHRNIHVLPNNVIQTSARSFIWSSNVFNKKDANEPEVKGDKKVESSKTEDKPAEKTTDEAPVQQTAKAAKTDEAKTKEKIVIENVVEQSLDHGEKATPLLSSEPIRKLKEKIIGKPPEDTNEPAKPPVKKRKKVDLSAHTFERNFVTPFRAMADFLLKPSDLESLAKTKRRSPYENEPPITVYWLKDVEAKSLSIFGTKENLQQEVEKRNLERKQYQQNIFTMKRRLRDYRRELGKSTNKEIDGGIKGRSGKVVLTAIAINGGNCLFKLGAWLYTGSHSMFSECIHSFADTINQLILAYGINKSVQVADAVHPYGYSNMKYVASLISGVGIFCVGTGLSFYHGITGIINPEPIDDFFWGYFVLTGSLVSESATWIVAFRSIQRGAKNIKVPVKDYILRSQDPSVNVVLLEDFAAVVGVIIAGGCMAITQITGNPIPDSIGSLLIGCILGCVASFIIYSNVAALVGRSIPEDNLNKINAELESDIMVRAIHDVKGIDMGNYLVRYKAELDFDGRELTRSYLDKQDLNALVEEARKLENIDQLEEFILKHGENIVDMMGGEIDRIEMKLRKKYPEIRHCDLEIL